tara:strand:- start:97 stop:378 length:282 start_codon:yes stop_codon:yes gene_type:complete
METIIGSLPAFIVVIAGILLWKYHASGTILWGSIGIIVYIGFVVNEMGKGIDFNIAWRYPSEFFPVDLLILLIGILSLISLLIGIYIEFKKRK